MAPRSVTVAGRRYWHIEGGSILTELPGLLPKVAPAAGPEYITLHWTAGRYEQPFGAYQILVGAGYILVSDQVLNWSRHQHTWRANTRNIGVSMMAMAPGCPVTEAQAERCAAAVGVLMARYNIPLANVRDHADWARQHGYYPNRVDVETPLPWAGGERLDIWLRRKSPWYRQRVTVV